MHFFYQVHPYDLFACTSGHMEYTAHIHAQLEMMYVTKGAVDFTINGESTRLHAGDLAVVFPHCPHHFAMVPEPEGSEEEVIVLVCNALLAGDYAEQLIAYLPSHPFVRADEMPPHIEETLRQLLQYEQSEHPDQYHPSIAKSYVQLLMAWLWPLLQVQPNASATLHSTTYRAIQYMMQHFKEPLSLETTAAQIGVSKRQLTRLFSETIHIGFHEYLLDLRTEHAKTLLQNTKLPITDIAFQSGFESQRTFNRAFRDFFHVTPREYRKRLALQHQNAAAADMGNADEDCP